MKRSRGRGEQRIGSHKKGRPRKGRGRAFEDRWGREKGVTQFEKGFPSNREKNLPARRARQKKRKTSDGEKSGGVSARGKGPPSREERGTFKLKPGEGGGTMQQRGPMIKKEIKKLLSAKKKNVGGKGVTKHFEGRRLVQGLEAKKKKKPRQERSLHCRLAGRLEGPQREKKRGGGGDAEQRRRGMVRGFL